MGPMYSGPIPYTAIIEWARLRDLGREWTMLLGDVIRKLDIERGERIESEMRAAEARRKQR